MIENISIKSIGKWLPALCDSPGKSGQYRVLKKDGRDCLAEYIHRTDNQASVWLCEGTDITEEVISYKESIPHSEELKIEK